MIDDIFPQEVPNHEVADTAKQFRRAANLIYKDALVTQLVTPLMVNCALSLELYLKSLNTKNVCRPIAELPPGQGYEIYSQPITFGHELTKLYDALFPELQTELSNLYAANPVDSKSPTIREALAAHDDLFVSSRYWFEPRYPRGSGRSITALIDLVNLIGEHVEKLPKRAVRDE